MLVCTSFKLELKQILVYSDLKVYTKEEHC